MQASDAECPLCMEQLEIDDVNFFPCTCGYQICRFCWHRIRTDENGLCPACRKPYSEDPAVYTPLSQDEIQRILKERKQKDVQRKQKVTENRKHLANVRVVQKNLVFVVGLTQRLADPELLKRPEYFSKFGKIHKIVVNNSTNYAGPQGPSASAYITYVKEEDAIKAIIAVCNTHLDGRMLKASLGTTKYCSYFLRNIPCPKTDCMYLHELGDGAGSFTKDDMQAGKHQEYEQQLIAFYSKKIGLSTDKDSKEDWSIEGSSENRTSPSLPSGAAWAGKSEDGDNTNKPVIANKDNSIPQCKEDWEDSRKPPATVPDHVPPTTVTQQPSKPTHSTNTNTGWGNTENACVIDTSSLFSADLCSGLGLANLHLKVYGEDDLGFDPWNECSKGLADLLQEEKQTPKAGSTSLPHTHSFLPPFQSGPGDIQNWQDGLRALLPNINISFSDSVLTQQQSSWPPSLASLPTHQPSTNWPLSTQSGSLQVRPPPGFECKQPSSHLSSVDDPSILWSKTLDPGNPQIRKPTRKPVPNGFPGVHNLTSAANLQNSSAVSSRERLKTSLNDESSQQHISNTNKSVGEFEKNMGKDITMSKEPSTEKSKNSITEATQRVVTNTKKDFVQQRKTRVSELSVIDVNEPIPTKRIHTPLDYEIKENKNLTSKIQKTRTHRGQVEEKVVRDRRQQDSYPKVGKKLRRNGRIDDQTNPRWS
ncbi:CCR4-NOT transcription complex subunit 4-like isoform X1 [Montipora capricornis]|uniref:CCR4-NOT transcription complex subunit 4-like isoform X1 n=1 Tax=Montipora capricornis TaxID=246305 RepID=UPI0035F215C0